MRTRTLAVLVLAACSSSGRPAQDGPPPDEAIIPRDVPPPTVDAPLPPTIPCDAACELPPSQCLDSNYLLYYTGGTCMNGTCELITNLMYCYGRCVTNPTTETGACEVPLT